MNVETLDKPILQKKRKLQTLGLALSRIKTNKAIYSQRFGARNHKQRTARSTLIRTKHFLRSVFLPVAKFTRRSKAKNRLTSTPEQLGLSSERLKILDLTLEQYVENDQLAGGVAMIARKGQIAHVKAFGWRDRESNSEMTEDVLFRIASQTKALASVGIMLLQEQGKLLISDPVGKYLPEFGETTVAEAGEEGAYVVVPANRAITIRDLLTHSSGIGYGFGLAKAEWQKADLQGWYFPHRDEPIRKTVARIASLPQDAHPGEHFVYGYNTDILGAVIEVVSGKPLDQFMSGAIFQPLGMKDTHFYIPDEKKDRLATVYSSSKNGIERAASPGTFVEASHIGQGHYIEGPRKSFSGGAGLISTVRDYGLFLQMLLDGGECGGKQFLSRKSIELMTCNHLKGIEMPVEGAGIGLGFLLIEDLGKYGQLGSKGAFSWTGAYNSCYWVDPIEDMFVVYLTQLIPAKNIDDIGKLGALVYQSIVD